MSERVEGFGIIPNWLVREAAISSYALLVYVALTGRADRDGEAWPSMPTLAREARCSESQARRALKELREAGLVSWRTQSKANGGQSSNKYRVNLAPPFLSDRGRVPDRNREGASQTPKEDTSEEDTWEEELKTIVDGRALKPTASGGRSPIVHSNKPATEAQVAFMRDCYILLHQDPPGPADVGNWRRSTRAEIHREIREYWSEIEHGGDANLSDIVSMPGLRTELSSKAITFITHRLSGEDRAA